jgi:predicted 2-oxoglutarate/Fe(II)-dependent dioxygenase YbiX
MAQLNKIYQALMGLISKAQGNVSSQEATAQEVVFEEVANNIFVVKGLMDNHECQKWIEFSEKVGYEEAGITTETGQVMVKSVRNNERLIYDNGQLAKVLWERVKPYVPSETPQGKAIGLNERSRFYKYYPGQQFKPHRDGSYERDYMEFSLFTFMIYLNGNLKGGTTRFENCEVKPETGKALIFKHDLVHEGVKVKSGVKYVLRTDVMYRRPKKNPNQFMFQP